MIKIGERYQTHIQIEFEDKNRTTELMSIHFQFCNSLNIINNMHRLLVTLKKSILPSYLERFQIRDYIKGILCTNKFLNNIYSPLNISVEDPFITFNGDSDFGWSIIFIKVLKNGQVTLESKFYNINGEEVSNHQLLENCEQIYQYQNLTKDKKSKLVRMVDCGLFNNTTKDLQTHFNLSASLIDTDLDNLSKTKNSSKKNDRIEANEYMKNYFRKRALLSLINK